MHIAILITNTDFSAFAAAHDDDGVKFASLLRAVRPAWQFTPFWVCKGVFPDDAQAFDGLLITGSPASVTEDAPWMLRLSGLIRQAIAARQPLFGACFGHQLIARTLGARIIRNPLGWGHGLLPLSRTAPTPWAGAADRLALYGSHIEQVATPPRGTRVVFDGPGLPVAGLALDTHVFTIQHHPEMTADFITALIAEYADPLGPDVTARARASLVRPADTTGFAGEIARFFEGAPPWAP